MPRKAIVLALCLLAAAAAAARADASASVRYGVQDDAWLLSGPGTLETRLATLDRLGTDIVRVTVRWNEVAPSRPANPRDPEDLAYQWGEYDAAFRGLQSHGIAALVTLYGSPAWANGGRAPNWLPSSASSLASFAYAVAARYPWIRRWTIWNEPNSPVFMRPVSPKLYTTTLLNPAFAALKSANPANLVAGGVTSPRQASGISPVAFLRGMAAAHAHLDAYAQNPYPVRPLETPTSGGCSSCGEYTMATLPKLIADVNRYFGTRTRIWLTEYGYNSKPPSTWLGVPNALQATYVAEAGRRAYVLPKVDVLINFLVRDEPDASSWSSGFIAANGVYKPAFRAFALPMAEVSRRGTRTVLWGEVRPRSGSQPYRLERFVGGRWSWLGATAHTSSTGYFTRALTLTKGAKVRIWSPLDGEYSPVLTVN
jgi:hypothetical protein